jgi:hypothetical protein
MPQRIQLRRTKGWRKPEGAIVVSRPSKWGNPYAVGPWMNRAEAAQLFRLELVDTIERTWSAPHPIQFRIIAESLAELRGHDLACWCPLDEPCHADVLLELANTSQ